MKETIAILFFAALCAVPVYCLIVLIRSERCHRRFMAVMAVLDDADKATDAIKGGRTMRDVQARAERVDEILELARAIKDER